MRREMRKRERETHIRQPTVIEAFSWEKNLYTRVGLLGPDCKGSGSCGRPPVLKPVSSQTNHSCPPVAVADG